VDERQPATRPNTTTLTVVLGPVTGPVNVSLQLEPTRPARAAEPEPAGSAASPTIAQPEDWTTSSLATTVSVVEGSTERTGTVTVTGFSEPDVFARASSWIEANNDDVIVQDISLHRSGEGSSAARTFQLRIYVFFL